MEPEYIKAIELSREVPSHSYLAGLPVVRALQERKRLSFSSAATFFLGENGTGKSTLLEAIAVACGFNAEGGTRNFSFSTQETHSELWQYITPVRLRRPRDGYFLRAESFYNAATYIDRLDQETRLGPQLIDQYGGISLHRQSHGESFLSLVQNRFGERGLYILDEPEAALSPTGQMTLLVEMNRLIQTGAQFLVATHSPILPALPGACLLQLSPRGMEEVPYQQAENVRLTRYFLNHPQQMVENLLGQEKA